MLKFDVDGPLKEWVTVLIEVYKDNVTVSCVGCDFLSDWSLYMVNSACGYLTHASQEPKLISSEGVHSTLGYCLVS